MFKVYDGKYYGGELSDNFYFNEDLSGIKTIIDGGAGEYFFIVNFTGISQFKKEINFKTQCISNWNSSDGSQFAKIKNIEHVIIHSENRVKVMGNEDNNR